MQKIELKFNKGHPCVYQSAIFCQEGYCSGCYIWHLITKSKKD